MFTSEVEEGKTLIEPALSSKCRKKAAFTLTTSVRQSNRARDGKGEQQGRRRGRERMRRRERERERVGLVLR